MTQVYLALVALALVLSGCYYDNEEDLYPNSGNCETTAVSYSQTVVPILDQFCYSCHDERTQQSNINLEGYQQVMTYVENGRLLGSIRWDPGYSPMPKNAGKLSDCRIAQIEAWIEDGAPDN